MADSEPRARDLLPPETPPRPVRPIAQKRVVGWRLCERLADRLGRRPAGNSRRFWSRIEDDDPFRTARPVAARPVAARHAPAHPTPPRPTPARVAPPRPQARPAPRPAQPAPPPAPAPVDRRPRIVNRDGLTPAQARERMRAERGLPEDKPPAPPQNPKSIDDYLQFLGDLKIAEEQFSAELARKEAAKAGRKSGGLDDLLGDGPERRVRIGKRSRPRPGDPDT